jgi:hypothetical protein
MIPLSFVVPKLAERNGLDKRKELGARGAQLNFGHTM